MRLRAVRVTGALITACLLAAAPFGARADELESTDWNTGVIEQPAEQELPPLSPEEQALLARALSTDPTTLADRITVRPLGAPAVTRSPTLDFSRTDNPDGTGIVVIKRSLSADWNASIGADLGLAAPPPVTYRPAGPMPIAPAVAPSSAAWASFGVVPSFATVDARVVPGAEQGRVGTTLQHSLPVARGVSVTLRESYAIEQAMNAGEAVWSNERGMRLNIASTGTVLSASLVSNSIDPDNHDVISAEQRLYGPLHVTTSVTDVGETSSNKSITAGFRLNW
jgi:hypothetical protein